MPKLKPIYWILITVFFIFFLNLDVLYINLMETRNMLTAREMVNHGHWLLTRMNDMPRYEKPPLPTWITAIFGILLGFKSFVVMRLPAAFMSLLTVLMVYKLGFLLNLKKKQNFIAALIMATTFYLIFSGRTNQWDVYCHAFMLVSIYFSWKLFTDNNNIYSHSIWAGLFFGCSLMSKGPVSPYALWLPFIISFGCIYKYKNLKNKIGALFVFIVISLVTGIWWYVYVRLADPGSFMAAVNQESSRWGNYNTRPFYYYWNFFIQTGIWTIPAVISLLYPYLKNRVSNKKAYTFTLLWTLISVVLLSFIPEKKPRYLLPTLIPLAINISFYIEYLFRQYAVLNAKEKWAVNFNHGLIAFICLAFPIGGYIFLRPEGDLWIWFALTAISLFVLGILSIYFMRKKNYPKVFYVTIAIVCCIMTFGFRFADEINQNPLSNNIAQLRAQADEGHFTVYEFGPFEPRIIWEYGQPIPNLDLEDYTLPQEIRFGVLLQDEDMEILDDLEKEYTIIREERFDNNYISPGKRGYKDRLVRNFFLLEKKQ